MTRRRATTVVDPEPTMTRRRATTVGDAKHADARRRSATPADKRNLRAPSDPAGDEPVAHEVGDAKHAGARRRSPTPAGKRSVRAPSDPAGDEPVAHEVGRSDTLSLADARRIAIAAQGLAGPRPGTTAEHVRAMVERLGAVQIDSVNVIARSHYLVGWSRLGAYDPAHLDRLAYEAPRGVFEYWGHEASLMPVALQPLFRWRMEAARHDAWGGIRAMARRKAFVGKVLDAITAAGPIGAGDLDVPTRRKAKRAMAAKGWWGWSDAKIAVEWLFWCGAVTTAARRSFERLYDLPARVLPPEVLAAATPSPADAQRALIERSARALGLATERDLRDYFRLKPAMARPAIAALVEEGTLRRVTVEGWSDAAYLHRDADATPIIEGVTEDARCAVLSPFDSLVWQRARTERLFGMQFRLEIYTPEAKRVHGYYVLPVLLGDRLVARIDVKADRAAKTLRVHAAHKEPGHPAKIVARALANELRGFARWLGLDAIAIAPKGDLAAELARAMRARG